MRLPSALFLFLLIVHSASGATVEVTMKNGDLKVGELVKEDADSITLSVEHRLASGKTMRMSVALNRSHIAETRNIQSLAEQYAERLAKTDNAPDAIGQLARWCLDNKLEKEGITQAQRALKLCPGQSDAELVLAKTGHVKVDEKWVLETEHLASQGKVRYRGDVLTKEEAEQRERMDNAAALLVGARQKVQDLEGRERKALKALAEEEQRKSVLDKNVETYGKFVFENKQRYTQLGDTIKVGQKKYDEAAARRIYEESLYGVGRANIGTYEAERAAMTELDANKKALKDLATALPLAASKLKQMQDSSTESQEKLEGYQRTAAQAKAELVTARQKLARLEAAAKGIESKNTKN